MYIVFQFLLAFQIILLFGIETHTRSQAHTSAAHYIWHLNVFFCQNPNSQTKRISIIICFSLVFEYNTARSTSRTVCWLMGQGMSMCVRVVLFATQQQKKANSIVLILSLKNLGQQLFRLILILPICKCRLPMVPPRFAGMHELCVTYLPVYSL